MKVLNILKSSYLRHSVKGAVIENLTIGKIFIMMHRKGQFLAYFSSLSSYVYLTLFVPCDSCDYVDHHSLYAYKIDSHQGQQNLRNDSKILGNLIYNSNVIHNVCTLGCLIEGGS